MEATLDAASLKPLTRALACISKFSDQVLLQCLDARSSSSSPSPNLRLSALSQSLTAYCELTLSSDFFIQLRSSHNNGTPVVCQLYTKSLLSVLRARGQAGTTQGQEKKSRLQKCTLYLASTSSGNRSTHSVNSRQAATTDASHLTIRMEYAHGVSKTHRLVLQNTSPSSSMALFNPIRPPPLSYFRGPSRARRMGIWTGPTHHMVCSSPQTMKDILEHFPSAEWGSSDAMLLWTFEYSCVRIRSARPGVVKSSGSGGNPENEAISGSVGKQALSTELTIARDEFERYDVHLMQNLPQPSPVSDSQEQVKQVNESITLGIYLRELAAAVQYADSLSSPPSHAHPVPVGTMAPVAIPISGQTTTRFLPSSGSDSITFLTLIFSSPAQPLHISTSPAYLDVALGIDPRTGLTQGEDDDETLNGTSATAEEEEIVGLGPGNMGMRWVVSTMHVRGTKDLGGAAASVTSNTHRSAAPTSNRVEVSRDTSMAPPARAAATAHKRPRSRSGSPSAPPSTNARSRVWARPSTAVSPLTPSQHLEANAEELPLRQQEPLFLPGSSQPQHAPFETCELSQDLHPANNRDENDGAYDSARFDGMTQEDLRAVLDQMEVDPDNAVDVHTNATGVSVNANEYNSRSPQGIEQSRSADSFDLYYSPALVSKHTSGSPSPQPPSTIPSLPPVAIQPPSPASSETEPEDEKEDQLWPTSTHAQTDGNPDLEPTPPLSSTNGHGHGWKGMPNNKAFRPLYED